MKSFFENKVKPHLSEIVGILALVGFYAVVGCPLRYFFGVCCPGCGMTRASLSILRLDFVTAFQLHPLVFIMPLCAAVFLIRKKLPKKLYNALICLCIVLFLVVYLYRLFSENEYVYIDPTRGLIYRIAEFLKSNLGG